MPIADDQPCADPLKTCTEVERYPDVISFWVQPIGSVHQHHKSNMLRYDFMAWLRHLVADKPSDGKD